MKNIGGQAVIEGVMMKSERAWSVAVRTPGGGIQVRNESLRALPRVLKLPLLRGVIALFHALIIGIKALEFSATASTDEEEEQISKTSIAITIGISIILSIALFILLPLWATKLIGIVFETVESSSVAFNVVDGVVRVGVFLLYVVLIGLWSEIRRVFEYHGAEHKVIHAFEDGQALVQGQIGQQSPIHPRCGTSFLMIVMVVSIFVFSLIPQPWPLWAKFVSRVVLIPLIAGSSYEVLKLTAKYRHNVVMRLLMWPGMSLQQLTTREPDDAQIEVALRALKEVLAMEGSAEGSGEREAEAVAGALND
jgi:uncharacterized protein YqhQ